MTVSGSSSAPEAQKTESSIARVEESESFSVDPSQETVEYEIPKEAAELIIEMAQQSSLHVGPLPRPTDYKEYDIINPGSAERILKMAEENQIARIAHEKRIDFANLFGVISGVCTLWLMILLGAFLAYNAPNDWAGAFGVALLAAPVLKVILELFKKSDK